jgi:hypothetical protein
LPKPRKGRPEIGAKAGGNQVDLKSRVELVPLVQDADQIIQLLGTYQRLYETIGRASRGLQPVETGCADLAT